MNDQFLNEAFLTRQPILDLQQELVGYELLFRHNDDTPDTDEQARGETAAVVCAAYAELGMRSALGKNRAYIRVGDDFLHDDAIELLPADGVVFELALAAAPDQAMLDRCRTLRQRNYSLALADYRGLDERSGPLLSLLDIVKIDIAGLDEATLHNLAGPLRHLPLKLLAQGVDTRERMERCRSKGFNLFQGNYFARPEIVSGRCLSATQSSLIHLINLAGRDADTAVIEDAFKHEPALTLNLLRIVNAVGSGLVQRISSLRHAITLLGRRQLQRWLQLLLMTPASGPADATRSPLLQVAALRGRMMELLSKKQSPRDSKLADLGFITGIMSMMPAALGLPMNEILEQIAMEPEVLQALSTRDGILGQLLALLECFDSGDTAGCDELLGRLPGGIDRATLNGFLAEGLRWVQGSAE